ncbi:hypothetical protein NX059_012061 [Plenodomus lindquistii]|nr:hypothetical protein NX059_012061 [Plenodomus lindquistii]
MSTFGINGSCATQELSDQAIGPQSYPIDQHMESDDLAASFLDRQATDCADSEKAIEQPPFRFLDLHSELRNRVYELAAAHDTDLVSNWIWPTENTPFHAPETLVPQLENRPLQFFYFAQTCRQIRREFRPMYLKKPMVSTKEGTEKFLEAFFPGCFTDDEHVASSVAARVTVCVSCRTSRRVAEVPSFYVSEFSDMLPLLRLSRRAPGLDLRFKEDDLLGKKLNGMFRSTNPRWLEVEEQLEELTGSMDHHEDGPLGLEFSFCFNADFDRELLKKFYGPDCSNWYNEMGLIEDGPVLSYFRGVLLAMIGPDAKQGSLTVFREEVGDDSGVSVWSACRDISR